MKPKTIKTVKHPQQPNAENVGIPQVLPMPCPDCQMQQYPGYNFHTAQPIPVQVPYWSYVPQASPQASEKKSEQNAVLPEMFQPNNQLHSNTNIQSAPYDVSNEPIILSSMKIKKFVPRGPIPGFEIRFE